MRRRVRVSGRVQGVGFRAATRAKAEACGVAGWVRNRPDGSVEAAFEGDAEAVAALVDVLPERSAARAHRARGGAGRAERGAGALRAPALRRLRAGRGADALPRIGPRGDRVSRADAPPVKRPPPCADGMRMGDPANAMLFFPPLPPVQLRPQASCVIGRSRSCNLRLPERRRLAPARRDPGRPGRLRGARPAQHERHLRERRADPGADAEAGRPHPDRRRHHHVLPGRGPDRARASRRSGRRRRS